MSSGCPLPGADASRFTPDETIAPHGRYVIVNSLLLAVVVLGVPLVGLLVELALLDTRRSQAVADAALRRALEPLDPVPARSPPVG
jgi:hypothetical protein